MHRSIRSKYRLLAALPALTACASSAGGVGETDGGEPVHVHSDHVHAMAGGEMNGGGSNEHTDHGGAGGAGTEEHGGHQSMGGTATDEHVHETVGSTSTEHEGHATGGAAGAEHVHVGTAGAGGETCTPATIGEPAECGNKIRENGETCDDGNQVDGDGCSSVCVSEAEADDVFSPTHPLHKHLTTYDAPPAGNDSAEGGSFRIKCEVSNLSYEDPIVHPCMPKSAHLHTFLGNPSVTERTTAQSLFDTTGGTCHGGPLNKSAYWVPTMLHPLYKKDANGGWQRDGAGKPVPDVDANGKQKIGVIFPSSAYKTDANGVALRDSNGNLIDHSNVGTDVYYKRGTEGHITAPPAGLRMIAGNAGSTAPQSRESILWSCLETTVIDDQLDFLQSIPNCTQNPDRNGLPYNVRLQILFPQCWDGVHLDSADHKSHMAYADGVSCPASHPVAIPRISYNISYPLTDDNLGPNGNTSDWYLSSDAYKPSDTMPGGYSGHGDWFMAWNPQIMATFVKYCLNERRHCADGELGNGYELKTLDPGVGNVPPIEMINDGHGEPHTH